MARLNNACIDSDDELPELGTLFRNASLESSKECVDAKRAHEHYPSNKPSQQPSAAENTRQNVNNSKQKAKQKPLKKLEQPAINSRSTPFLHEAPSSKSHRVDTHAVRSSPRKSKPQIDYSKFMQQVSDSSSLSISEDDGSETDLSGFIVPDSASEDELKKPPRQSRIGRDPGPSRHCSAPAKGELWRNSGGNYESDGSIELLSPKKEAKGIEIKSTHSIQVSNNETYGEQEISGLDEPFSRLKFSPPRSKSPHKIKTSSRPVTPPLSLTKPQLQSPSKRHRIPPSPHRPSIDAFWSQEVINDWNEQYSPKKNLKTPKKSRLFPVAEDDSDLSPSESPQKSPTKSPSKRDKAAVERRKAFDARKNELAISFLAEIDSTIADGQVATLAASTGGIKLIWSKKLNSTAGRANWRREVVRSKNADGTLADGSTQRHHASIELAEKVIDSEDRLLNVIAHEYCHLANFMISGVKDNPHGKEFKVWACKCTEAFRHRGIEVTTKHTYEIEYKYVWACTDCEKEYKRHSKSVDPTKHACGSCKGKLIQIKPVPRKNQDGKQSEFQEFVKSEQGRIRKENPGLGLGEVMAVLGREFRERRGAIAVKKTNVVENSEGEEAEDLEDMARKPLKHYIHIASRVRCTTDNLR